MSEVPHPKRYERSDVDPRLLGALALSIVIFLGASPYLLSAIFPGSPHLGRIPGNLPQPPAPRLQVRPKLDLDRLRADEHDRLDTAGWIDRKSQVVHIPIARAMELTAQRGLPGWPSAPADQSSSR